jgi:hypothetical protein
MNSKQTHCNAYPTVYPFALPPLSAASPPSRPCRAPRGAALSCPASPTPSSGSSRQPSPRPGRSPVSWRSGSRGIGPLLLWLCLPPLSLYPNAPGSSVPSDAIAPPSDVSTWIEGCSLALARHCATSFVASLYATRTHLQAGNFKRGLRC